MESLQRQLAHELGPAVEVVGVVGRPDHVLGQVELLGDVLLDVVGIDTARGGEHELVDAGVDRRFDHQTVDDQVPAALGVVHLHVATTAVDRGQVEHIVHALAGAVGRARRQQVRLHQLDHAAVEVALDVFRGAAREVVHHTHVACAALDQAIDHVRADERCAAGDQDALARPVERTRVVLILVLLQCLGSRCGFSRFADFQECKREAGG